MRLININVSFVTGFFLTNMSQFIEFCVSFYLPKELKTQPYAAVNELKELKTQPYAAVNGHIKLPLLKDRQRFDAISTSNLEVY